MATSGVASAGQEVTLLLTWLQLPFSSCKEMKVYKLVRSFVGPIHKITSSHESSSGFARFCCGSEALYRTSSRSRLGLKTGEAGSGCKGCRLKSSSPSLICCCREAFNKFQTSFSDSLDTFFQAGISNFQHFLNAARASVPGTRTSLLTDSTEVKGRESEHRDDTWTDRRGNRSVRGPIRTQIKKVARLPRR